MPAIRNFIAAAALIAASTASAQEVENPLVDYDGFLELAAELQPVREAHRLGWDEFAARAQAEGAIILDTRSASAFHFGHIKGAVNLPFSDFTDEKLAAVLGPDRNRPILIYCNNNFSDNIEPVPLKKVSLALNIPTFINLHGYGYTNVWELGEVLSIHDERVAWASDLSLLTSQSGQ